MDWVSIMGKTIGHCVGHTTIQVLIHNNKVGTLVLTKIFLPQFIFLKESIIMQRLICFERRLWSMGLNCSLFPLLSNLGIYSSKNYLNQGLKISKRNWWDGNSLLQWCLNGSVDGHYGYCLFCSNLSEQREHRQSSIQPRLEWYLTYPYFDTRIFIFQTQKIPYCMFKLKILDSKILIECPEHIHLVYWSLLIPYHPGRRNSILHWSK